jgi:hypothetical protein
VSRVTGGAVAHVIHVLHVRLVLVLEMQHLLGIHMYREGSVARRTARSTDMMRRRGMGDVAAARQMGLTLSRAPTPHYIGVPNGFVVPRDTLVLLNLV